MSIKTSFAKKVYCKRKEKNITQEELAEIVSISSRWLQEIERGNNLPSAVVTLKLIIVLELDVSDLMEDLD